MLWHETCKKCKLERNSRKKASNKKQSKVEQMIEIYSKECLIEHNKMNHKVIIIIIKEMKMNHLTC